MSGGVLVRAVDDLTAESGRVQVPVDEQPGRTEAIRGGACGACQQIRRAWPRGARRPHPAVDR